MSIRIKLLIGFAIVVTMSTFIAFQAIVAVTSVGEITIGMYDKALMAVSFTQSARMNFSIVRERATTLLRNRNADPTPEQIAEINATYDTFLEDLEVADERLDTPQARQMLLEIRASSRKFWELASAGLTGGGNVKLDEISAAANDTRGKLDVLIEHAAAFGYNLRTDAERKIGDAKKLNTGIFLASILVGALCVLLLSRNIADPIKKMTNVMGALSQGDLEAEIPSTNRSDEVGDMARAVVVFKENMITAERLQQSEMAERRAKERRTEIIESLMRDFDSQVAAGLESVTASASQLQQTAQRMASTAADASRQSAAVASASEEASANVQTVAATAEELSTSIAEIGRQVTLSAKIAATAVAESEATNATVQGLADAAGTIGEVVGLISDIAGRTNLLALNATIEAARAGEAGKGFAVVAQEVKNLATQTAHATEEIARQINTVQEETSEAVAAIEKITGIIGEINDIATTIASAIEEQSSSTEEIARSVQQAARGTEGVTVNIGGVNKAAGDTGTAAGQVLSASQEMSRQAEGLRGNVDWFLKEIRAA